MMDALPPVSVTTSQVAELQQPVTPVSDQGALFQEIYQQIEPSEYKADTAIQPPLSGPLLLWGNTPEPIPSSHGNKLISSEDIVSNITGTIPAGTGKKQFFSAISDQHDQPERLSEALWKPAGKRPVSADDGISTKNLTLLIDNKDRQPLDKGVIHAEQLQIAMHQQTARVRQEALFLTGTGFTREPISTNSLFSSETAPTHSLPHSLSAPSVPSELPVLSVPSAQVTADTVSDTVQQPLATLVRRDAVVPQTVIPQRLGTELIQMLKNGDSGLEVRLDPPELGRMSLSVSLDADSLSLQVTTTSATARDLMLGQADRLRQELAIQNLNLSALSVDVHSGKEDPHGQQQKMGTAYASETLLTVDWENENSEFLPGTQLFRSRGGRLLDHFV